jgi:NitT/TauT family transport system substrate-binding protein
MTDGAERGTTGTAPWGRRYVRAAAGALLAAGLAGSSTALADEKLVFTTNWFAEAEHGGFYQALATGIYKKYGLDVTIKMGGPQVNSMQLLAAGQSDIIMGYDIQTMNSQEQGIPAVTVGVTFQKDPQGMLTHEDVTSLDQIKTKTILIAGSAHTSYWPWLKTKYGLDDGMTRPYTFNVQPFMADKAIVQQGYVTSEPFAVEQAGGKCNFFLFADFGYPPYAETMVTLQKLVDAHPAVVGKFVKASLEGWKSYMHDPAPGNALIKKDNPAMTDDQLAYSVAKIKAFKLLDGGEAAKAGIGHMSDARFKQTFDLMVANKLLDPSKVDLKKTYTTRFMKDVKVLLD